MAMTKGSDKLNVDLHMEGSLQVGHAVTTATDQEAVKQIEMQLHEQFAQNYNSTFGPTITLFCTMLAVLYAYGFVFLHSSLDFSDNLSSLYDYNEGLYTLDALTFVTITAFGVLAIMKFICLNIGINQRMEQFIIHAIRQKYYGCDPVWQDVPKIFPRKYTPFGKKGDAIVIGMYGGFIKIICGLQVFVLLGLVYKFCYNVYGNNGVCNCTGVLELYFLMLVIILCYGTYDSAKHNLIKKYHRREKEYFNAYCNYSTSEKQ